MIYKNLKKASEETNKFNVYWKEEIPKRYHYSNNDRIGPILAVANIGYSFQTLYDSFKYYEKEFHIKSNIYINNLILINFLKIIKL